MERGGQIKRLVSKTMTQLIVLAVSFANRFVLFKFLRLGFVKVFPRLHYRLANGTPLAPRTFETPLRTLPNKSQLRMLLLLEAKSPERQTP